MESYTFSEIMSQPDAWADAWAMFATMKARVHASWQLARPSRIIVTGCGSTHYLAQIAAHLLQSETGVPASAYPASELIFFGESLFVNAADTLLLTISRSGTTSETLAAVARFQAAGGQTQWTITCYPDTPLANSAELVLLIEGAQEQSVAQTRSFSAMLFTAQLLAATLGGRDISIAATLPAACEKLLTDSAELMAELGANLDYHHIYFLGSGARYGVANEVMLKMTEMALTQCAAYHFMEFRHGPMSMAAADTLIVGLISKRLAVQERSIMAEMNALGAQTLALDGCDDAADFTIAMPSDIPQWLMPVLYLPPLQLLAYHRALSKGLNPDKPRHLTAVVYLDAAVF